MSNSKLELITRICQLCISRNNPQNELDNIIKEYLQNNNFGSSSDDFNIRTLKRGYTILHICSRFGLISCLKYLIHEKNSILRQDTNYCHDINIDLNVLNYDGETPLYLAVKNGYSLCATALIECGANLDCPEKRGISPLARALSEDKLDIVRLLVLSGCDLSILNPGYENEYEDVGFMELTDSRELIDFLLRFCFRNLGNFGSSIKLKVL